MSHKEVGAKADTGKVDLTYVLEYFPRAIEAISRVAEFGDVKYTKITGKSARGSWRFVPDGLKRYTAALFRHAMCVFRGEEYDREPEEYGLKPVLHRAQRAWNDLATLELWLIEQETENDTHTSRLEVFLVDEDDRQAEDTGVACKEVSGLRQGNINGAELDRSIP